MSLKRIFATILLTIFLELYYAYSDLMYVCHTIWKLCFHWCCHPCYNFKQYDKTWLKNDIAGLHQLGTRSLVHHNQTVIAITGFV